MHALTRRVLTVAALLAAALLVALLMFRPGGGDYTLKARFLTASQVSKGGLVEVAGKPVGNVTELRLADDGSAELTLSIDSEHAPLPRGTRAQVRQFGLSGPASRYVELQLPPGERRGDLPDGSLLGLDSTTSNVDLDEVFAIFDRRTRKSLKGVIRGSHRQYRAAGQQANQGWAYLDPTLVASTRLFSELNRDTRELERFVIDSSRLVGDVAERRDDLADLVDNLAETTGAISRPRGALADAIARLPGFMRQANTTYVNLRAALDDLEPLVEEAKPVARKLRPYLPELRGLVEDAEPTITALERLIRRPGSANDLLELSRATPPLRDIAIGPVRAGGREREGAFPATAEALASATPRLAFARPYSVDFTGWLDDFSHTGFYDALGGTSRTGTHVGAFSFKNGVLVPLAPALRAQTLREVASFGQNNRCPGSVERDPGDRSTPLRPSPDYNCDPGQLPVGP